MRYMKTEVKKRFDELCDKYYETFGENYPLVITDQRTLKEVCDDIEKCLKTIKKAEKPKYKKGADY